MTWHDRLRPATFRGVPFHVEAAESSGGRRGQDHEYPGRDEPYAEDAGKRAQGYRVTAYTIGDDYDLDRKALEDALNQAGPGTLVHPYYGTLQVVCRQYRTNLSTRTGGAAFFDIDFVEAGRNLVPVSATDTAAVLAESAESAGVAMEVSFEERFAADFPAWITDAAMATVQVAADVLEEALAPITAMTDGADFFRLGLLDLRAEAGDLVLQPILLARRIRGLVQQFRGIPESSLEIFHGLIGMGRVAFGLDPIVPTTETRARQQRNRDAIESAVRRSALYEGAASIHRVKLASRAELIAVRDLVEAAFEDEILLAGDDPTQDGDVRQLERVFANAMRELSARDNGRLARIRVITLPAAQPALLIAHRLYQDAKRAQEIVDRNRVTHPLFVPGGIPLQVLTSA